jgi:hypothetical protein
MSLHAALPAGCPPDTVAAIADHNVARYGGS